MCYRKNVEHKRDFSHPGDSDYDTDPDDDRPSCSYGRACYRRNSEHRRDYKHPGNSTAPPKPQSKQPIYIFHYCNCCCNNKRRPPNGKDDYESDVDSE